jgi:hypothetical protein
VLITQQQDFHTNHANSARHKRTHLQNSESNAPPECIAILIPWLFYWSLSTSFPFLPALSNSGLTTTCTVLVGIQKCCCSMATPAINLMWSDDAQLQKPHCCCYIQNNHLTSIWQYETRPTKIMHPKHKKEIQIMITISTLVPTKMCLPLLGTTSFLPQVTLFPFLIWSVMKCFFFFRSFVWMKFTA